ncbi:acyltransferase [Kriegella aquimaris]|uniref:Transferase hexapeptide (Six repeat-containing protein) n=1 Tax=Kriegella aquimaris TaxID=192904 RepID=A0A1G9U6Q5_9FLAO|nr:DapH/DapD/GlmU-related protein [Kriegella aquimaris]SDM55503.1 transferase hexapeptide (six repeat-containing protein) [Kriegella aquimaris]
MSKIINKTFNKINFIRFYILNYLISTIECGYLKLIGVELGNNCSFRGWTSFKKANDSIIKIDENCRFNSRTTSNRIGIRHKCMLTTFEKDAVLQIGSNSGFSGVSIGCFIKIVIGNNVKVGANVLITDSDWHLDDPRVSGPKPVFIGDNVWLGYGVVVMKGVTIGENSIIGINSVVTKDIPANVLAAGNPCKVIKEMKS